MSEFKVGDNIYYLFDCGEYDEGRYCPLSLDNVVVRYEEISHIHEETIESVGYYFTKCSDVVFFGDAFHTEEEAIQSIIDFGNKLMKELKG